MLLSCYSSNCSYLSLCRNYQTSIYLCKVSSGNTGRMCEIGSKLTIKTPQRRQWHHYGVFNVNFEPNSLIVLVFSLLILYKLMLAEYFHVNTWIDGFCKFSFGLWVLRVSYKPLLTLKLFSIENKSFGLYGCLEHTFVNYILRPLHAAFPFHFSDFRYCMEH